MDRFVYNDKDWSAILRATGPLEPSAQAALRETLQRVVSEYRFYAAGTMRPAAPRREQWKGVETAAAELLAALRNVDQRTVPFLGPPSAAEVAEDDAYFASLQRQLEELRRRASANAASYHYAVSQLNRNRDPDIEQLYHDVLAVWTGDLQKRWGATDGGPMCRFFVAVLRPVLGDARTPKSSSFIDICDRIIAQRCDRPTRTKKSKQGSLPRK